MFLADLCYLRDDIGILGEDILEKRVTIIVITVKFIDKEDVAAEKQSEETCLENTEKNGTKFSGEDGRTIKSKHHTKWKPCPRIKKVVGKKESSFRMVRLKWIAFLFWLKSQRYGISDLNTAWTS